jgi:hypothetical protein
VSLMEIARTTFDQHRRGGKIELVASYDAAFARAVTLAPTFRADREAFEAIAPCKETPSLPAAARHVAHLVIVLAAAAASLLVGSPTFGPVLLGAGFGVAAAFSGDRVGAAVRTATRKILSDPAALLAPIIAVAELAAISAAAALASGSAWSGLGLALLGAAAAVLGHATRVGDAEAEARESARRAARRRLEQSEQAIRDAVEALRAAHAADLARIASEMGRSPMANPGEQDKQG